MKTKKIIIGIDEAGRGPLAGPVAVGAFAFWGEQVNSLKKIFKGAKDSKLHTEKERGEWFCVIKSHAKAGNLFYSVSFSSSKTIDKNGIVYAIQSALKRALRNIVASIGDTHGMGEVKHIQILLDGGLVAPKKFKNQKTIIKGDAKIKEISLASICAKVLRDKKMIALAKMYPQYNFDIHKGYGTKKHFECILKNGPCSIHRKTFLIN